MSLRFVKTSVLSSEDGIDFSKEINIESEEAKIARIQQERASHKSLYEQLEEQKAKKDAEYEAVTKQIFAPPKAIDDEEYGFLQHIEDEKRRKEDEIRANDEEALTAFRASMREGRSEEKIRANILPVKQPTASNSEQTLQIVTPILRVKRKSAEFGKEKEVGTKVQKVESSAPVTAISIHDEKKEVASASKITSLLGDYNSDDD